MIQLKHETIKYVNLKQFLLQVTVLLDSDVLPPASPFSNLASFVFCFGSNYFSFLYCYAGNQGL